MSVEFTYDIGYMGVVKMSEPQSILSSGSNTIIDGTTILATGGNITVTQNPIFTSGVWGAGWYNAALQIAYAPNYITTNGSINFELTYSSDPSASTGSGSTTMFAQIQDFAFLERNLGKFLQILPNGIAGYKGNGWCLGCSFSASADQLVTGDTSFKTGNVTNCIYTDQADETSEKGPQISKDGTNPINDAIGSDYLDVFPFWASGVKLVDLSGSTESLIDTTRSSQSDSSSSLVLRDDIMDWNTSYSSLLVLVATCKNATSLMASQLAKYAALGTMTALGSFTIFRIAQDLDPDLIRACRHCQIEMGTAKQPDKKAHIEYGAVVFSNGSTDVQTGSSFIQSSFSFTALGDGQNPVMKLTEPA